MTDTVTLQQLGTWGVTGAGIFVAAISAAVWAMLNQATSRFSAEARELNDRFVAEANSLKDHLRRHADEEQEVLDRLANEQVDTRRRVGVLHERVEALNTKASTTPSIDAVHNLSLQLQNLAGEVKTVVQSLIGLEKVIVRVERQIDRHEDALLQERRQ